jgi:hypothetical protein
MDKGQAEETIQALKSRRGANRPTYKMSRTLAKYGLNPDMSFDNARKVMDYLAKHDWRPTPDLYDFASQIQAGEVAAPFDEFIKDFQI